MKKFSIYAILTCLIVISISAQSDSERSALKLFGLDFTQVAIDVLNTPSACGYQILMTNLKGHTCLVFPAIGKQGTISLIGNLFDEISILHFARYLQQITFFEDEHPQMFQQ